MPALCTPGSASQWNPHKPQNHLQFQHWFPDFQSFCPDHHHHPQGLSTPDSSEAHRAVCKSPGLPKPSLRPSLPTRCSPAAYPAPCTVPRQAQPPCFGRAGSSRPAKRTEFGPLTITQLKPNSTSPVPDQSPPDGPLTSLASAPVSGRCQIHRLIWPRRTRPTTTTPTSLPPTPSSVASPPCSDPSVTLSLDLPFPSRVPDRQPLCVCVHPYPVLFSSSLVNPSLFFSLSSYPHMHPSIPDSSSISSSLSKSWLGN